MTNCEPKGTNTTRPLDTDSKSCMFIDYGAVGIGLLIIRYAVILWFVSNPPPRVGVWVSDLLIIGTFDQILKIIGIFL